MEFLLIYPSVYDMMRWEVHHMEAEKLRAIMKRKQIGNKELAQRSGVPLGTLNKILYGDTKSPSLDTMQALANALDCTLNDFSESDHQAYYLNSETAKIAQEIYDDPNLKILFDASQKATPDELRKFADMMKIMLGDHDD
jgi:transcriptional regulator with XRE-family HTH domain